MSPAATSPPKTPVCPRVPGTSTPHRQNVYSSRREIATDVSDIYGLQFDLVFDPAVLQYQPPAMEGGFLNRDSAATILQVGPMQGNPGRLIVAIVRQGVPAGLQATAAEQVVITLPFRGVSAGSTTLAFQNAAVVDSSLQPLASITFGGPLTLDFD